MIKLDFLFYQWYCENTKEIKRFIKKFTKNRDSRTDQVKAKKARGKRKWIRKEKLLLTATQDMMML